MTLDRACGAIAMPRSPFERPLSGFGDADATDLNRVDALAPDVC